jgi:[amino group carrier protein]-L-2-aminoadipate 6-kinase
VIHVLKIGGGAGVDHRAPLANLAERVRAGEQWVLVHGASDAANRLAHEVGYHAQTLVTASGHSSRYTDPRTLEIFCAAAANVNGQTVAALHSLGVNAVGLAGPAVIRAERKTAIRAVRNGRQVIIRDDYSGSITGVDHALVQSMLDMGRVPVIAPIALGAAFERLNIDGDLAAANLARALNADTLIILSNVPGLLRDVSDDTSLVTGFALSELSRYESFAGGRMKKKLLAAEAAQVDRVILADSRVDQPLDAALAGAGTHITRSASHVLHVN